MSEEKHTPNLATRALCVIGALFPGGIVTINAGVKLTVGRIGLLLLLAPALAALANSSRRKIAADLWVLVIALWMIGVAAYAGGSENLSSAGAQALEFSGGYFVARGLFSDPAGARALVDALKPILVVVVLLALVDTASGRPFVHETLARLAGVGPMLTPDFRMNLVRAVATFDHPILLGSFCTIAGVLFMNAEQTRGGWLLWVGLSAAGCFLALSSAPMLSLVIALALFAYSRATEQQSWRWSLIWFVLTVSIATIFLVTNHPVGWIISHLTFDPVSGYFRLMIWDRALPMIGDRPITGHAFALFNDYILDTTVDSVWLVLGLRYGVPLIVLLVLANVATMMPTPRPIESLADRRMATGFSMALFLFMLTGFTVHYWHYLWILWGLCLGVRGSLRADALAQAASSGVKVFAAPMELTRAVRISAR